MARILKGQVVRATRDKTAAVEVTRFKTHPLYGKKFRVTKKYLVHDPEGILKLGQGVEIVAIRPISKRKSWAVNSPASKKPGVKS